MCVYRWGLGTSGQLPHPAFLAFGYGPRACIASDLVLLQLKVALVHCMRLVEFDVARQDPLPPNQHLEVSVSRKVASGTEIIIFFLISTRKYSTPALSGGCS